MKTKLLKCKKCGRETLHYIENTDKVYTGVIGLFTLGLVIPRDMKRVCSVCGRTKYYDGTKVCGVL
jgi:ribosomal protein L37E|nr:MAG TPA: nucleic-acid-binding protein [Caudoviricetes sp.]